MFLFDEHHMRCDAEALKENKSLQKNSNFQQKSDFTLHFFHLRANNVSQLPVGSRATSHLGLYYLERGSFAGRQT